MSGIAQLFLKRGIRVSGSDLKETKITEELKRLGARVFIGHGAANIEGADVVVYSSAIKEDNPEICAARQKNLVLIKRAQALAELMKDSVAITVTGSHGKTTTTSLASYLLLEAGLRPTVAIGGILKNIETNASLGEGKFFVAEADESDGSFLYYKPKYSIITNIDREHLDFYRDFQNELAAFGEFINQTDKDGCVFASSDDAALKNIMSSYKYRYVFFGLKDDAHIYPKNIEISGLSSRFDCYYNDKFTQPLRARAGLIGDFHLALGGKHNISNALSVIALGLELGIDVGLIKKALSNYRGTGRRIEIKFKDNDYLIIDDYAHHPTEIKATLSAVKALKAARMIVVFQPHRYTRTKLLLDEFGKSFALADCVIITDIYPASEPPIAGVDARLLCEKVRENNPEKEICYLPKQDIAGYILKNLKPRDLVITLGAGDIIKTNEELVARLKR